MGLKQMEKWAEQENARMFAVVASNSEQARTSSDSTVPYWNHHRETSSYQPGFPVCEDIFVFN